MTCKWRCVLNQRDDAIYLSYHTTLWQYSRTGEVHAVLVKGSQTMAARQMSMEHENGGMESEESWKWLGSFWSVRPMHAIIPVWYMT